VEKPENSIEIDLTEPVSLTFSLKYLTNFCKARVRLDEQQLPEILPRAQGMLLSSHLV
jgi:hypothetical protein